MAKEEHVSIGDKVTFEFGSSGAFLSVNFTGHVTWAAPTPGAKVPSNFTECIWRVCDKLSYIDHSILQKQFAIGGSEEQEALISLAEAEKSRNLAELAAPSGRQARYGQVVQLQHVSTGKFLSAKNTPAKVAHDCLGLFLGNGDASVYFELLPRYKVRAEGGPVLFNDVVLLEAQSTHPGYFIHASVHTPSRSEDSILSSGDKKSSAISYEANLSSKMAECGITVSVYEHRYPPSSTDFLHVHQCVRFFDREADGFIAASCMSSNSNNEVEPAPAIIPDVPVRKRHTTMILSPKSIQHRNSSAYAMAIRGGKIPGPKVQPPLVAVEVPQIKVLKNEGNEPNHALEFSPGNAVE